MPKTLPSLATVALHLAGWALYVLSEYLANYIHLATGTHGAFIWHTLLSLPVLMIPTYFVVGFAVPRYLKKGKWLQFVLILLAVAALVFYARLKWFEWVNWLQHGYQGSMPPGKILKNVIRDYSLIALAVCLCLIAGWQQQQQRNEALIRARADAEMQLLKAQLHPHFLFNTLNNLYSLALSESPHTAESILRLTELLDYLVYWANKDRVPLSKEVQLLHNYLELERLRHGVHLCIETQLDVQNDAVMVSPLLLLPFVENCFKHGGKGADGRFSIRIRLYAGDSLRFDIHNSKRPRRDTPAVSGGLGLQNIRKRLALTYPGQHSLDIYDEAEYFHVSLQIEWKNA